MPTLKLGSDEYERQKAQFFKDAGGAPDLGMFGTWGWKIRKEGEFQAALKAAGFVLDNSDAPSARAFGQFKWRD